MSFHTFALDKFPIVLELFASDGELVWSKTVAGPSSVTVPGYGPGSVALARATFGDGSCAESRA